MKEKASLKIFLAHAREDENRVRELYERLKAQGYSPWLDKVDLMPGQQWREEIPKAIHGSSIFLACLSQSTLIRQGYIQNEFRLALEQAASIPKHEIYIIPVKFDECELPTLEVGGINLGDFQWVNYWEEGAFTKLEAALEYKRGLLEVATENTVAAQYAQAEGKPSEYKEGSALEIWREKLAYFREQEAITADAAQKFELPHRIRECVEKIRELEGGGEPQIIERDVISEFRQQVREYLVKRYIKPFEKTLLESLREELHLTPTQVEAIIREEEAPIQRAREEYKNRVLRLIEQGYYPFDSEVNATLAKIKATKNLTDWEVEEITQPIFAQQQPKLDDTGKLQIVTQQFETVRVNRKGIIIARETKQARTFREDLGNGVKLEMVYIPEGKFLMGTEEAEIERLVKKFGWKGFRREAPQQEVKVAAFWMSKYPITQEQWRAVAGLEKVKIDLEPETAYFKGEKRPVERVNWSEAVEYGDRLTKLKGRKYKLPSEAQWEYGCRGGTKTPFAYGETLTTELANYDGNYTFAEEGKGIYREETTEVGKFYPNPLGLCDMHGNVWEWCEDDWQENYKNAPEDGSAWINRNNSQQASSIKILCGGSCFGLPWDCRSAYRINDDDRDWRDLNDVIGFRLVCPPRTPDPVYFCPFALCSKIFLRK